MLIQPLNRYTWVDEWYSSCWLVCCCRGDWCAVMSDWNWRGSRDGYLLLPPCCYSCLCCCCSQMRLLGGLCPIVWVKHCLVRVMVSVSVQFRFLFSPFFSLYVYTIYVYIFFDPLSLPLRNVCDANGWLLCFSFSSVTAGFNYRFELLFAHRRWLDDWRLLALLAAFD